MRISPDQTVVVAGNGPSLQHITPGTVLAQDVVFRTNNFFFEPRYFLGSRVDLAMMGGDPRVAPFVFETLWRCRQDYTLAHWSSHDPQIARTGQRRFATHFVPMPTLEPLVAQKIAALCQHYARTPTTGIQAVMMAYGLGARRVVLVGIDFYSTTSPRYIYSPGRNYRALMGQDIGVRGVDRRLHDPNLDRAILSLLADQPDIDIHLGHDTPALQGVLDQAPIRTGPQPECAPRTAPPDWANWAGLYPIGLLRVLRWGSARLRYITGHRTA